MKNSLQYISVHTFTFSHLIFSPLLWLFSLHWLRVPERISFKGQIGCPDVHRINPRQSCFTRVADMTSRRRLRSSASHRLEVPSVRLYIQSANGRSQLPAPTCGTTFCSTSHLHSHSQSSNGVSRLSSSLVLYPDILI